MKEQIENIKSLVDVMGKYLEQINKEEVDKIRNTIEGILNSAETLKPHQIEAMIRGVKGMVLDLMLKR